MTSPAPDKDHDDMFRFLGLWFLGMLAVATIVLGGAVAAAAALMGALGG